MASVVTTSGTYDLEMSGLGTELPQGKSLDLRNVITALCCNSESALSFIPTGIKNDVYFVCKSSGLDLDFSDDCSWATGSSVHRSLYVCLPNNALKRVFYKDKLYVFPQLSGGQKTLNPLDPQPSHDDILEIHTRNFCHSESLDYKKRITWISKLPIRIWPVLPKTACVEYLGTSPEVPSSENESYRYMVQEEVGEVQNGPYFEQGNNLDLEQLHVKTIGESYDLKNCEGPANGNFIDSNLSCEGLNYDIPVLNLEDIESCSPQDLPYEPVYVNESVELEELATQTLYFYVSPNCSTNSISSLIPVTRVADSEKVGRAFELSDSQDYETDLLQLYADISAKHEENIGSKCSSGDKSHSVIKDSIDDGTPLPFGKYLDLKNIVLALKSQTPLIKIPKGLKKDAYFIVKKCENDECGNSLSKCYEDEFAWVGCHEKSETFCCKKNNEFERLSLGKKNVKRSTEDELLIVRSYGSTKAPLSLQKRITSITNAPSYLHASISQAVCVEYIGKLEGPIREEETDSASFSVGFDSCGMEGGNFLPLKSTLICGIPLLEGNFLDIKSLLAALVSRKSVSCIPNGTKEDVYFVCNESSNLFCRETGEISPFLDEFDKWYSSHSVIVTFVVCENGSHERCYLEDDLYYRRKKKGDHVIYELFDPQPSSENILEINRNHASSLGLWRRITWVIRAPGFLCSVVPNCACVEYLGSHGNGFCPNECDLDATDRGQDEDELACLEGLPLPEGKFLSPRLLLQAMRSARLVEQIPAGLKSNVYFIIGIERVKDLRADEDWCSGSEVTHEIYYVSSESTACVRIFKKRGFYCAKKSIPLLPQPSPESILEVDRHTSTWRESTLYRRQISWITKVPSHVAPLATNLACVEYVVDSGASLEFVDDHGEGAIKNKKKLGSGQNMFKVSTEKQDIMQLHSFLSINDTDSLSLDVSIPISDFIKRSFVRNVGYDEKGKVNSLILYTDEQIMDLCRFCCSKSHRSVLGVKTLFKDQGFNVTVLTYTNYSVIHVPSGKHPLFIGPIFIHKNENDCAYNLFFSHMKDTFLKTHGTVRGGRKFPWIWGCDISRTVRESLALVFRNSRILFCVEAVKSQVQKMVMDYLSESPESRERLLHVFAGPEGLCSSCNEEQLDSRISMTRVMGNVPSKLLQKFMRTVRPILNKNFISQYRNPWIEPLWVNGSESMKSELLRAVSESSDLILAKGSKSGETNSNLGALINNLYGYVVKQVTELFNVLKEDSNVLILSKEFKSHKINRDLTKKLLLENFWVFLGVKNYDRKFDPSKEIESNVVKNTTDPELVVQQKNMFEKRSNGKLIPLGKSEKVNVSPSSAKILQIGKKISNNSVRYTVPDKCMKGVKAVSVKRNTSLSSVGESKVKRGSRKPKTAKEKSNDIESSNTQAPLDRERFHAVNSCLETIDEYKAQSLGHENDIVNGLKGFECSPNSKGKKTSDERLVQLKITEDRNLNHNTQVSMPSQESTGNSFGDGIKKPQASKKRKRSDQTFEPITSLHIHDSSLEKHENVKGLQGKFLEKKESVPFVDNNSSCCPEGFPTEDSVVEVMEPKLKIQRRSITSKVRGSMIKFVNGNTGNLLDEQKSKITEVGSGDSNCIPGQIVESPKVKNSKASLHNPVKVENKPGKSLKHKKTSIVSGKLGGKRVVKGLKVQQRRLPQKSAAQTKGVGRCDVTRVKKPHCIVKKKCHPNWGGKRDKKGIEMQRKESRKRQKSFNTQVNSDKSQESDKGQSGLSSLSNQTKSAYKEDSCLKSVVVRLEILPQKKLKALLDEGFLLHSAK